mmetsp:Transcript_8344/g.33811  ORF Transcript_8344/g.33811 Transcript_8344/m.33811 type:complete len:225 (+) Transcript_8344:189-863(+)
MHLPLRTSWHWKASLPPARRRSLARGALDSLVVARVPSLARVADPACRGRACRKHLCTRPQVRPAPCSPADAAARLGRVARAILVAQVQPRACHFGALFHVGAQPLVVAQEGQRVTHTRRTPRVGRRLRLVGAGPFDGARHAQRRRGGGPSPGAAAARRKSPALCGIAGPVAVVVPIRVICEANGRHAANVRQHALNVAPLARALLADGRRLLAGDLRPREQVL